jgi:hypothetical protein
MKKLTLLLLIPVIILSVIAVKNIQAKNNEPEYQITLGNTLDGAEMLGNKYIELPEEAPLNYNFIIPDGFDKIAEDDTLELYVEPETLAIAVRVIENGYVYSSYNFNDTFAGDSEAVTNPIKSGVTVELYKGTTPVSFSYLDKKSPPTGGDPLPVASSTIQPITNGFTAKVDFDDPEIQIRFDMNVTIEDGSLVVNIPPESIQEYNPNIWNEGTQYYILRNIIPFRYFGSTKSENDGYVVIPDGSGALISLENAPEIKASFTLDVYGDDLGYMSPSFRSRALSIKETQRITMPIYGMVHDVGNTGFLVISEEGANYSELSFKSAGLINDYYSTFFRYKYRESYEQYQSRSNEDQFRITFQDDINDYNVKQRYIFLSGTDADYVGMAKSYQQYLLDNGLLSDKHRKDYDETPTKVDFIGTEITLGTLRTTSQLVTTYNQMVETLKTLQNDGYKNIITSLKTYDMDDMGYRFDVYRKMGGKSDFKDLIKYMNDNDIEFSYYIDYVRSYKQYTTRHAQTLSKRNIYHVELSWMFFAHLVNETTYYLEFAQDDVEDLQDLGINGVALNGFDRSIFTSYDKGISYSTDNMDHVNETLSYFQENDIMTGVYIPDQYMYNYVDEYYDAPISSSDYSFISASVPFLQLVLGGYMDMYSPYLNFASDEQVTLLRLVEFGVFPSYILTGESTYNLKETNSSDVYISEYDVLKNRMSIYYTKINSGLTSTIGKEMIDHTFIDYGVVEVEYDDGTIIIINYNSDSYVHTNITIPGLGYVVVD